MPYAMGEDIDPSYEEIFVDLETRKLETGTMHILYMFLALIVPVDTCQPTRCRSVLQPERGRFLRSILPTLCNANLKLHD